MGVSAEIGMEGILKKRQGCGAAPGGGVALGLPQRQCRKDGGHRHGRDVGEATPVDSPEEL